jgi:hypothetical protein
VVGDFGSALERDSGEIWEAHVGGNPSGARGGGKKIEVGGGRAGDWGRERRVGRGFRIGRVHGVPGPIFLRIGFFWRSGPKSFTDGRFNPYNA